ncbi:hypothetical protein WN55_09963 [Dufourea novaeangliae]|uniref:Uncharacterized protein n=1 Tax=Dufourea novaeangliae TaxID=178035 RepID=A0A154P7U7_DUFNO|nr:hypothetical protein WN55_09963 [Dufourea novaeangliae]
MPGKNSPIFTSCIIQGGIARARATKSFCGEKNGRHVAQNESTKNSVRCDKYITGHKYISGCLKLDENIIYKV